MNKALKLQNYLNRLLLTERVHLSNTPSRLRSMWVVPLPFSLFTIGVASPHSWCWWEGVFISLVGWRVPSFLHSLVKNKGSLNVRCSPLLWFFVVRLARLLSETSPLLCCFEGSRKLRVGWIVQADDVSSHSIASGSLLRFSVFRQKPNSVLQSWGESGVSNASKSHEMWYLRLTDLPPWQLLSKDEDW